MDPVEQARRQLAAAARERRERMGLARVRLEQAQRAAREQAEQRAAALRASLEQARRRRDRDEQPDRARPEQLRLGYEDDADAATPAVGLPLQFPIRPDPAARNGRREDPGDFTDHSWLR